jgi:hypothetical protein
MSTAWTWAEVIRPLHHAVNCTHLIVDFLFMIPRDTPHPYLHPADACLRTPMDAPDE